MQGGRTKDFSKKSKQQLTSVVEIFDPHSELWEQRQVTGDGPSPGTFVAASASLHDDLCSFGGWDGHGNAFNTLHRLDTKTWCWCQLSPQNAEGAPMPKWSCGMISFRDSLGEYHEDLLSLIYLSRIPSVLMAEDGSMSSTSTN